MMKFVLLALLVALACAQNSPSSNNNSPANNSPVSASNNNSPVSASNNNSPASPVNNSPVSPINNSPVTVSRASFSTFTFSVNRNVRDVEEIEQLPVPVSSAVTVAPVVVLFAIVALLF
eukprot:TRINITY_DN27_c0_g1_i3.p4 TRINITY_DN27_c0_g1~~TRINITY_DN27_c0_g1_i3.p4  ORF type:complete len:119 (+),score=74.67 TRINITY_DN27_c0_g1_i3:205-561(+)